MTQQLMQPPLRETASQTAGPYVHIGLAPQQAGFDIFENNFGSTLVDAKTKGERIRIEGRVFDGIGTVLKDILIEIWQANADGRYAHPADRQSGKAIDKHFRGWGRGCSDFAKAWRQIVAAVAVNHDTKIGEVDLSTPSVVLNLMQPLRSGWRLTRLKTAAHGVMNGLRGMGN